MADFAGKPFLEALDGSVLEADELFTDALFLDAEAAVGEPFADAPFLDAEVVVFEAASEAFDSPFALERLLVDCGFFPCEAATAADDLEAVDFVFVAFEVAVSEAGAAPFVAVDDDELVSTEATAANELDDAISAKSDAVEEVAGAIVALAEELALGGSNPS